MSDISLQWLGQSGFLLRYGKTIIACDLYLSDYCKKRSKLDHTRMMQAPVEASSLKGISFYLITHSHIDHFDPETVGPVMTASPSAKFYCPPSGRKVIDEFFPSKREPFVIVNSNTSCKLADDIELIAIPAAHEELEKDADGEYIAFSYVLNFPKLKKTVFFAGDTIPYAEQAELIKKYTPAGYRLTLVLPVNGRDAERAKLGFKGNLTLDEAVDLYKKTGAAMLVPCHFGMFALNNIREELSDRVFFKKECNAHIPVPAEEFII